MKKKKKNLSQMAKGKIRASLAERDSKGRFLKADHPAEVRQKSSRKSSRKSSLL
ncbi:MAG: hypothetical protein LBU44_00310 [Mediterranea sp.]|nr:hypothetical protein [Mediterranea sp.]